MPPDIRCKWLLLLLISTSIFTAASAQNILPPELSSTAGSGSGNGCSNDILLYNLRNNPAYRAKEEAMNRAILLATGRSANTPVTVPVVVHIINANPSAISDAQVIAGIADLNDAFARTGAYAAGTGVDARISFCLSKKDPDGGNTNGITRTESFYGSNLNMDNEDARLKNLIQWDPARYINIWFISSINAEAYAAFNCGSWYRLGVGGYATMPPAGGPLDGIVATAFGTLLAHEMGHYLGLYHTFEGGCTNFDCQINGDRVCDTPPDVSVRPSPSCASPENSCSTDTLSAYSNGFFPADVPDLIANFMDYGNAGCSNGFTQGQADRMHAAILTQRAGLLMDECTQPCAELFTASFTRDQPYPLPGTPISFTNTSAGASSYEWLVNDIVVGTTPSFSCTFTLTGKNKVTLKAYNADPACFSAYTDFITVTCGVSARFYTNKKTIASRLGVYTDSIRFTNTSVNGTSYQWLMSNNMGMAETVVATSTNLTYVFPVPATYRIRLVASNGSCIDTTEYYMVPVLEPTADAGLFNVTIGCSSGNQVKINFCVANYGYAPLPKNTPVSFYDNDPRVPGANLIGSPYLLPNAVPGGNCYVCFSRILNVPYHGLPKVFIVFNDDGSTIPLALPNTSLQELSYTNNFAMMQPPRTTVTASICQGQNISGHSTTGVYIDTFAAKNGCDSIRTLNLTVKPVFNHSISKEICAGESYAGHSSTGTYVDVYQSANLCDSTVTLQLLVKPRSFTTISAAICEGENYAGHSLAGTYTDVYPAANGCDSTRTLRLTVNPVRYTNFYPVICAGQSYFAAGANQVVTGIYRDTLNTYLGCDSILITNLTVNPLPVPDLGRDRGVCIGSVLTLNPGAFQTYLWQDGSTSPVFTTNVVGRYHVLVEDVNGCRKADTMNLTTIYSLPKNYLPVVDSLCKGNIVTLKIPGYTTYYWSNGSTDNYINVTETGRYTLKVIDRNGCAGTDSTDVYFFTNCVAIQVPDVFTPNGDGTNERFLPMIPAPLKDYQLQVFNRWGQKVFETRDRSSGWNGRLGSTDQPPGVYVYVITFKDGAGNALKKQGTLTLVR